MQGGLRGAVVRWQASTSRREAANERNYVTEFCERHMQQNAKEMRKGPRCAAIRHEVTETSAGRAWAEGKRSGGGRMLRAMSGLRAYEMLPERGGSVERAAEESMVVVGW